MAISGLHMCFFHRRSFRISQTYLAGVGCLRAVSSGCACLEITVPILFHNIWWWWWWLIPSSLLRVGDHGCIHQRSPLTPLLRRLYTSPGFPPSSPRCRRSTVVFVVLSTFSRRFCPRGYGCRGSVPWWHGRSTVTSVSWRSLQSAALSPSPPGLTRCFCGRSSWSSVHACNMSSQTTSVCGYRLFSGSTSHSRTVPRTTPTSSVASAWCSSVERRPSEGCWGTWGLILLLQAEPWSRDFRLLPARWWSPGTWTCPLDSPAPYVHLLRFPGGRHYLCLLCADFQLELTGDSVHFVQ